MCRLTAVLAPVYASKRVSDLTLYEVVLFNVCHWPSVAVDARVSGIVVLQIVKCLTEWQAVAHAPFIG